MAGGSRFSLVGRRALVTGANRGLGARLVGELLDAGARRVYASARRPEHLDPRLTADPRVRTLLQVHAEDHTEADLMFTTLMGDQVEPRRKFIEDNALDVKNLDV